MYSFDIVLLSKALFSYDSYNMIRAKHIGWRSLLTSTAMIMGLNRNRRRPVIHSAELCLLLSQQPTRLQIPWNHESWGQTNTGHDDAAASRYRRRATDRVA